jgi:hypothetical protein
MQTIVIRVRDVTDGQDWPIELCCYDGTETWHQTPLATGTIPRVPQPLQITPLAGGDSLTLDGLVPFLLSKSPSRASSSAYLEIGQYLFDLLHNSGIGQKWDDLRDEHEFPIGAGLRTILEITPPTLRHLPWEALTNGTQSYFVDSNNPWVRGPVRFSQRIDPYLVPLRVLIVVGDPNDSELKAEEEVDAIRAGLLRFKGRVEAEFLLGPTLGALDLAYQDLKPDVFHFIGHGVEASSGLGPALQLKSGTGGSEDLLARDIQARFVTSTGRLAVLNACRSDRTADPDEQLAVQQRASGLADAFRQAGFRAVVGMQGDIPATSAVSFSRTLYQMLGDGNPIDAAVAAARRRIGDDRQIKDNSGWLVPDWLLPSLVVTTEPERLLTQSYAVDETTLQRLETTGEFATLTGFVDRTTFRRNVWSQLALSRPPQVTHLLVVHGSQGMGKSWLVRHALRTCAWRGHAVRYIDFSHASTRTLLQALWAIRDGTSNSYISQRMPPGAWARLTHALNFLRAGQPPPAFDESAPPPTDSSGDQWAPVEHPELIFQYLIDVLRLVANEQPYVLVLDQLEQIEESALRQLVDYFLLPVARGEASPVKIVVVLRSANLAEPWWREELTALGRVVPLGGIEEAFVPLAREFSQSHGYDPADPRLESLIRASSMYATGAWNPAVLWNMKDFLVSLGVPKR